MGVMADQDLPRSRTLLAAPDAFKGTASAVAIARAIGKGAAQAGWESDACPLSDGGEGFAEVLALARGGRGAWRETTVTGPLGEPVAARWWLGAPGRATNRRGAPRPPEAVIESASASGLPLVGGAAGNDPLAASTKGTGELIVAARDAGARRILVGVGGTATTDGGRGAVEAIETSGGIGPVDLRVACDVDIAFVDAAARFAPQKGADAAQVEELRIRLVKLARSYRDRYGVDVDRLPGAGAAGGLAGGLAAIGARLMPGFALVAEAVGLHGRLSGAALVVTGEGGLDRTSLAGKVVGGVTRAAVAAAVPVLVVAGTVTGQDELPALLAGEVGGAVDVLSLVERFGAERAMADPAGCVAAAVASFLRSVA